MNDKFIFGIDIGGTTIKLGLFTDKLNLIENWVINTDDSDDASNKIFIDIQKSCIDKLKEHSISIKDVLGIGIGIPGPIENKSNLVAKCANLKLNPCNIVEKFNFPEHVKIIVENDANMATLGEYSCGAGNLASDLIFIVIGTGIGAGIISNGKLVTGTNGAAGEIGHMLVPCNHLYELSSDSFEEVEKLVSGINLEKLAERFLKLPEYKASILHSVQPSAKNIFSNQDDELSRKLIDIMSYYIGLVISYSCSTSNPEKVVIGGGVSAAKGLIEKIEAHFKNLASSFVAEKVSFHKANLLNNAGIYGAASYILFDKNNDDHFISLANILGFSNLYTDIYGKDITSFKVGGKIKYYATPDNITKLSDLIKYCLDHSVNYFVIGNGTNLLISDKGYDGVIISLNKLSQEIKLVDDCNVYASSSVTLKDLALFACENSLSNFEFAHGIPGSLGGALYMNAGAYESEMKNVVVSVDILDPTTREVITLPADELDFSYRNSRLKQNNDIVLGATIRLEKGNKTEIQEKINYLYSRRCDKQPLEYPSAGSVFKRPEGNFAGKLISDANLKDFSIGGAKVSPKHAGFIVNYNNATSDDIINLINYVQNDVYRKFGIMLEREVIIIN